MKAPCKDCPDRHYLCHSTCEKYIAFQEYRKNFLEKQQQEKKHRDDLWESCRHSKKKKNRFYEYTGRKYQ